MIEQLKSRCDEQTRRTLDLNAQVIKAAALLHDLGHGPFSHVFERVFEKQGEDDNSADHEYWTCRILIDPSTEVHQALNDIGIDPAQVAALTADRLPPGVREPEDPYLKDIVHSQLDADRMDYLLRDSVMTGSRFGNFDSEWILNVLAIGTWQRGRQQLRRICLDASKGSGAIEGMLHARLLMTRYVYGHKTTRAYEAELICTLRLALELADVLPDETPAPVSRLLRTRGQVAVNDFLTLDDEVMWWALRRWAVWNPTLENDRQRLADAPTRHSVRLVRRHTPWATQRLVGAEKIRQAPQLYKEITSRIDEPLRFECYLDTMTTWPYKDPELRVRQGEDAEEAFLGDICLLESGKAVPIRETKESVILDALAKPWAEHRFHYDRKFSQEFARLLTEFGLC